MGRGVIGSVTDQMMAQFAQNLQVMLTEAGPAVEAPVAPAPTAGNPAAATATTATTGDSLNAVTLAGGMLDAQLRDPRRSLQLVALVAVVAYALGQRAGPRSLHWVNRSSPSGGPTR